MRFKGYLKKDGYLIRVSSNDAGAYQIEYSNDNWRLRKSRCIILGMTFWRLWRRDFCLGNWKKFY